MRYLLILISLVLLPALASFADGTAPPSPLVTQGERIYRSGELTSGEMVQGRVQGDVHVNARQLTCVQCHRRSGFGSSESGQLIPAITAPVLFTEKKIARRELYTTRSEGPGTRPAYSDASLARAIREGVDSGGRVLAPSMPRFALSSRDMTALIAYLKTLSAGIEPGVTETEIHIATLIGPAVNSHRSDSMLTVMNTFITSKNSGTRHEAERAEHTPWQKASSYPAYRKWVLHPWRLRGAPAEWSGQLQQYYKTQPVFAVVGGIVDSDFQPIADFCNANSLPCLFPSSDLPAANPGFYTLHFNEGRRLEAQTLALHLRESGQIKSHKPLLQVYRTKASMGANALRDALGNAVLLEERHIEEKADSGFWRRIKAPGVLIVWLDAPDLLDMSSLPRPWPERIYLQSEVTPEKLHALPAELRKRIYLLYPYSLPKERSTQLLRVSGWLRLNGIDLDAPREQADAYFAITLFSDTMRHIGLNYSRAYVIETIEHMLDDALFTSLYPQVSLAPGQRYASKGCYLVRLTDMPEGGIIKASRWIVP